MCIEICREKWSLGREKGRVVVKTKVVGIVKPSLSLVSLLLLLNIGCVKTGDLTLLIIIRWLIIVVILF